MKIIRTNIENLEENKKMLYKLTKAKGYSVKDVEGVFPVHGYLIYEDVNAKGEMQTVTAVLCEDVEGNPVKLQSISMTFRREFEEIADLMAGEDFAITLIHGTTKSGRDFVSCELYCD